MTTLRKTALLALVGGLLAAPALADAPLVVQIDHNSRLTVAGAAASVLVGNPKVADVTVVDSHTLFVQGKAYGQTDVVVLNENGDTLFSGDILVAGPVSNRVSVYRGATQRSELTCAPGCQVVAAQGSAGGSGGASAAPAAATAGSPVAAASNIGAAAAAVTP